jgi:hypothetical protein
MPTQDRSVDGARKALVGKPQETQNSQNCAVHHASRPPCNLHDMARHVDPRSVRRQEAEGNGQCVGRDRAMVCKTVVFVSCG